MTTGLYLPKGAMPKDVTFAQLVKMQPIARKLAVVEAMYESAIDDHNVRAAQWLAQVTGEWSNVNVAVLTSSPMLDAIAGMREALGLAPLGQTQAIDAQATLVPSDAPAGADPPADVSTYVLPEAGQVANEAGAADARADTPAPTPPRGVPKSRRGPHRGNVVTPPRQPTKNKGSRTR